MERVPTQRDRETDYLQAHIAYLRSELGSAIERDDAYAGHSRSSLEAQIKSLRIQLRDTVVKQAEMLRGHEGASVVVNGTVFDVEDNDNAGRLVEAMSADIEEVAAFVGNGDATDPHVVVSLRSGAGMYVARLDHINWQLAQES